MTVVMNESGMRPALRRIVARLAPVALLAAALAASAPARSADARTATPPITSGATAKARDLLAGFYARANRTVDRVAIGQQMITYRYGKKTDPAAWYGDWLKIMQKRLPLPEIMGGELSDLMRYGDFFPNQNALNEMIRHGRAGHIVTLVWHPDNPVDGGAFGTPVGTAELQNMVKDDTATGQRWQVQLDRAAAVLRQFANADVPVLFRPLHEQNGTFFWWGDDGQSGDALSRRRAAWTAVWRDMVTDLTQTKGLKNLLFVFGTDMVDYAEVVPPLTYYPGADMVDMVSIDTYDDALDLAGTKRGRAYYDQLVGTGKPFGLSEFGHGFDTPGRTWDARTLTRRLRDSYPKAVFAVAWYSSEEALFGLGDLAFTKQMMADPLIDTQP